MRKQKLAIIIGSTHGIGKACVKQFLDCGFRVMGCARGITDTRGREMTKNFLGYSHSDLDVRDEDAVKKFFSSVKNADVVLICAGTGIAQQAIDEINLSEARKVIDVNLAGVATVMKYALPHMNKKGSCLAVCGSIAADDALSGADWSYASAKAGLIPLLKFAAEDKRFAKISFVHLKLGFISTRMTATDNKQAWLLKTPYARTGEPVEIAEKIFSATQTAVPGYSEVELIGGNLPNYYPAPKIMGRNAGVLMPIFALPNEFACGTLGKEAKQFVKKITAAGFSYWLILPVNPTGISNSPYCAQSVFGGNVNLISVEALFEEKLLSRKELQNFKFSSEKVDYGYCYVTQPKILEAAWKKFSHSKNQSDFQNFCDENTWWLEDFAVFFAIKETENGRAWQEWSDFALRTHEIETIKKFVAQNKELVEQIKFGQYIFFKQLERLIDFAHANGVKFVGDLPFYVSVDSADCWANRELFDLNEDGAPKAFAGTPHIDRRHWGVAAYNWINHVKDGFAWWRNRVKLFAQRFDALRLDHASGFVQGYIIPADAEIAPHFEESPGQPLMTAITNEAARFGTVFLAEDLGKVPDDFCKRLEQFGWFGMRIIQYASRCKYGATNIHAPINYSRKTCVFSGTHDNPPLREYLSKLSGDDLNCALSMTGAKNFDELRESLLHEMYFSRADFCTLPVQDMLDLGEESAIVYHEDCERSWLWRLDDLSRLDCVAEKFKALAVVSGRLPADEESFCAAVEVLRDD